MADVEIDEERAIERVLYRYARGVDRRDLDLVRSCYWDDAIDDHEGFAGTADEFCTWLAEVLVPVDVSTHQFTNVVVDVEAVGSFARSEAYCLNTTVWRLAEGGERHLLTCLSYTDTWAARDGEWRVLTRRCRRLWSRVEQVAGWPPG